MNRKQWLENLRFYKKSKVINFVLSIFICLQLIFGVYLLVPIVSPKLGKVTLSLYYDLEGRVYATVNVQAATKYKITQLGCGIRGYHGEKETFHEVVKIHHEGSTNFQFSMPEEYRRYGQFTYTEVDVAAWTPLKTESMASDAVMMIVSFCGAIFGALFLWKKIGADKILPSLERETEQT